MSEPQKLILTQHQAPGDLLMLTAAVRDLHRMYPGRFVTDVRTSCPDLWLNNPHITPIEDNDREAWVIKCDNDLIQESGRRPVHFLETFHDFLGKKLNIVIRATEYKGDIHLSHQETTEWIGQVEELMGGDTSSFWLLNAGHKNDYTTKAWEYSRYQKVVDALAGRVRFVQCGASEHEHPPIKGVLNLVGKTTQREFVRLMHHAAGCVTGVSFPMHLAAAVATKDGNAKPCVVIAGAREPRSWEAYDAHAWLGQVGSLPCCKSSACWRSRVIPLGDGDEKDKPENLCLRPMTGRSGQVVPSCMHSIAVKHVVEAVEAFLEPAGD